MHTVLHDLKFGLRMLAKNPGFTCIAVLTLALGIGANTAIFSVVNAILLRPLPFPNPGRLVMVWESSTRQPTDFNIVSAPNFWDWEKQNTVFESMAMFDSAGNGYNLASSGGEQPEQVSGVRVTASFFHVLGASPFLGRAFLPEEEQPGHDHEVVLSYGLWQRRYAGDRGLVGKSIKMDGADYTVVGVMPPSFQFQFWSDPRQLWVPVGYTKGDNERGSHSFVAFARLKPGVTLQTARAEMDTIGRRLAQQYPQDNPGKTVALEPMTTTGMQGLRTTWLALLAVVAFVLLIACVNVANLLLARGATRQKELAIRCALGAGSVRIACQLLTESLTLAAMGGVLGILVAGWCNAALARILPWDLHNLPLRPLDGLSIDSRVLAFTLLVSGLTGVLFGLAPVLSVMRSKALNPLKEAGRESFTGMSKRLRHALVATEVALALMVLAGAGLLIGSMLRLVRVKPGLDPHNVLTLNMSLPQINIYYGPPVDADFCRQLDTQVGAVPGVVSASAISHVPLSGGGAGRGITIEGRPDPGAQNQLGARYTVACPGYFRTMGIPIRKGREFTHQDTLESPGVVVINETMAKRYWPGEDAVGKRFKIGRYDDKAPWLTVVGVEADTRQEGLAEGIYPAFFRPYAQAAWPYMAVVVRTKSAPAAYAESVKKALTIVAPDEPVSGVESMENVIEDSLASRRFPMLLLGAFAFLALVLAAVGIGGVVSNAVAQRTHEIGVRMALGAARTNVLSLMVRQTLGPVLIGVAVGLAGSAGLSRLIAGMLFDVQPGDPVILGVVSLVLIGVAMLACYLPARRATRVDPLVALRYE
jgi:putative ABC transport system permease protein